MDAAERQALFEKLERRSAALPQADGIEVDDLEVPNSLRRRDVIQFVLFVLVSAFILGITLHIARPWLEGDQPRDPVPPGTTSFWDSLFSREALTFLLFTGIASGLTALYSRYSKTQALTRKAVAQRISALVVETTPAQVPLRREGEFTVVLEDESGDQTLYHADESLARELHAGTAGLAVVAHHKLLAFQPLGA
jgi:hypothetical protein